MLVLSRKPSETILIGPDIKIVVIAVRGGAARLGIEAPSHVTIVRGELRDRPAAAATAAPPPAKEVRR